MGADIFSLVLDALRDGDHKELAKVYIYTLRKLVELEQKYIELKRKDTLTRIQKLNSEGQSDLEECGLEFFQEDEKLRQLNKDIVYLRAGLKACTFALEALKLQEAKTFSQDKVEKETRRKPERIERPKNVPPEPTKTILIYP